MDGDFVEFLLVFVAILIVFIMGGAIGLKLNGDSYDELLAEYGLTVDFESRTVEYITTKEIKEIQEFPKKVDKK